MNDYLIFISIVFQNDMLIEMWMWQLDRHHAWWSLDPTLGISSPFVKKESILPLFSFASFSFKKDQLFIKMHIFFCIWLITQLSTQLFARLSARLSTQLSAQLSARLSAQLSDASQSDYLVSLSYPMAIFSANLFGLFRYNNFSLKIQD